MQVETFDFNYRAKEYQKTLQENLHKNNLCKEFTDFVLSKPFFTTWKKGTIKATVYQSFYSYPTVTFHVEEVNLSDFIEGVLGVIHRWKRFDWEMEIAGNADDPVFMFEPVEQPKDFHFKFRVKEGAFTSCTVKKLIKKTSVNTYTDHEYSYEMECM